MIGAVCVVIQLTALVLRRPQLGAWLLAVAALLSTYGLPGQVVVAGFQVTLLDLVCTALVAVVVARSPQGRSAGAFVVALSTLVLVATLRGVQEFTIATAVNAARPFLYLVVGISYVGACMGSDAWNLVRLVWCRAAIALMATAALFIALNGLGTYATTGERALIASQALIVGQAGVIALASNDASRRARLFALACFLTVLASQQRTVWAATMAAVLVVAVRSGRIGNTKVTRRIRAGLGGGLLLTIGLVIAGPSELRNSVDTAVDTASTTSGTFGWRVDGWVSLLDSYAQKSEADRLIGQPMGSGFERTLRDTIITVSPHNMYITVLISLGLAGAILWVCLLLRCLKHALPVSVALHALIVGLLVFSIGYQFGPEQALLIGAAWAMSNAGHYPAETDSRSTLV